MGPILIAFLLKKAKNENRTLSKMCGNLSFKTRKGNTDYFGSLKFKTFLESTKKKVPQKSTFKMHFNKVL